VKAIIKELSEMLNAEQRAAFAVFLDAEIARRAASDADFDATVRSMMGEAEWEKAIISIPRDLLRALFNNAEAHVATRQ
jgi:hypothetical protein